MSAMSMNMNMSNNYLSTSMEMTQQEQQEQQQQIHLLLQQQQQEQQLQHFYQAEGGGTTGGGPQELGLGSSVTVTNLMNQNNNHNSSSESSFSIGVQNQMMNSLTADPTATANATTTTTTTTPYHPERLGQYLPMEQHHQQQLQQPQPHQQQDPLLHQQQQQMQIQQQQQQQPQTDPLMMDTPPIPLMQQHPQQQQQQQPQQQLPEFRSFNPFSSSDAQMHQTQQLQQQQQQLNTHEKNKKKKQKDQQLQQTGNLLPQQNLLHQPSLQPEQWQQFQDALDTIDYQDKKIFLQAQRQVPHLVAEETNPMQFLTYCRGNTWSAVQRLCLYWRERHTLFQEKTFLPLNLTGRGSALTNQELLCLQGGYPAVLPKTKQGQPVFLVDRRQLTPQATPQVRLRCMFYLAKLFASKEFPHAQTEGKGILCLHLLIMPRLLAMDRDFLKYVKSANRLLDQVFPIQVQYRVICQVPKGGKGYLVQNMIAKYVKSMVGDNDIARQQNHNLVNQMNSMYNSEEAEAATTTKTFDKILDVHIEQDEQLLFKELTEAGGLYPEGVPDYWGGKYSMVQAALWCQQQARQERDEKAQRERIMKRQKQLLAKLQKRQRQQLGISRTVANGQGSTTCSPTLSMSPGQQQQQQTPTVPATRKRRRTKQEERAANVLHSRRKRERRKQEEESLRKEFQKSQLENSQLKKEHERLQELLKQALAQVRKQDTPLSDLPVKRDNSSDLVARQAVGSILVTTNMQNEDNEESPAATATDGSISTEQNALDYEIGNSSSTDNDDSASIASGLTAIASLVQFPNENATRSSQKQKDADDISSFGGDYDLDLDDASVNSSHWPIMKMPTFWGSTS